MQTQLLRIDNCSEQDTQNLEEYVRHLYGYIKNKLQFKIAPLIKLIDDEKNSQNPLGQTGHYDPDRKEITVFITDRHIKDVLRSIAHELIHHNQNCNNKISGDSDMSEGYAQRDQDLRNLEEEAYSQGNLLFRDWENQMKTDEPLYEALDDFKTKQQKLLTEAVYSKFGFSAEFLKEADTERKAGTGFPKTKHEGPSHLPEEDAQAAVQVFATNYSSGLEREIKIISEHLLALVDIISNLRKYEDDPKQRASGYAGTRIKTTLLTPLMDALKAPKIDGEQYDSAKENAVVGIVAGAYRTMSTLLKHFQNERDESGVVRSSQSRPTDPLNVPNRMQPWGTKALEIWLKVNRHLFITLITMIAKLININPNYSKVKVAMADPQLPKSNIDMPLLKTQYHAIIGEIDSLTRQVREEAAAESQATATANVAPTAKEPETKPAPKQRKGKKPEIQIESNTRKNTENILRLLEGLTKGKK
jgi:hypothetical protein